jgi:hypothetical protein
LLQEQPAAKAGVKVRVSNTGTLFRKAFWCPSCFVIESFWIHVTTVKCCYCSATIDYAAGKSMTHLWFSFCIKLSNQVMPAPGVVVMWLQKTIDLLCFIIHGWCSWSALAHQECWPIVSSRHACENLPANDMLSFYLYCIPCLLDCPFLLLQAVRDDK